MVSSSPAARKSTAGTRPTSWSPQRAAAQRTALDGLARLLAHTRHERIVISGGPRCGKSTLGGKLRLDGYKLHHGEELEGLEWSAASERASRWLDESGPWICENVAMARALRKWLARNPTGLPADLFIQLDHHVVEPLPGQHSMRAGCTTVWEKIEPELVRRGAKILRARHP